MANTTNFNWETPDDTDLVKDGAAAIRTLGSAIDTSLVDLKGGTTGQVLSKATNTDMDFTWVAQDDSNAIQNAIIDAKGDLIVGASSDTPARLAVGTNNYVLTADSSATNGIKWAAPAGGGGSFTKIASASFTTQSSVAVDDVFTGSYKTYCVFWSCSASVDGADLQMQFRYAGPNTQATDYYGSGFGYDRSNTLSTWGFSGTNQATIYNSLVDSGNLSFGYITFDEVGNSSAQAKYFGNGFGRTTQTVINYAGFQNTSRTYTGFLLKPDSGTITGRYQVYGLEN